MHRFVFSTNVGQFTAFFSGRGLSRLEFPSPDAGAKLPLNSARFKATQPGGRTTTAVGRSNRSLAALPDPRTLHRWETLTAAAVRRVLAGGEPGLLPPLDLSQGTAFQQRVWEFLCLIPRGSTSTYGALASALGNSKASRAVGRACGANPLPVLVPCHRVVSSDGSLGGFSGGLPWKRRLLGLEGRKELA